MQRRRRSRFLWCIRRLAAAVFIDGTRRGLANLYEISIDCDTTSQRSLESVPTAATVAIDGDATFAVWSLLEPAAPFVRRDGLLPSENCTTEESSSEIEF